MGTSLATSREGGRVGPPTTASTPPWASTPTIRARSRRRTTGRKSVGLCSPSRGWWRSAKPVWIGIGIRPVELQHDTSGRHLQLARQRDLPVVIHCRDAEADMMPVLLARRGGWAAVRGDARLQRHGAMAACVPGTRLTRELRRQRDLHEQEVQALRAAAVVIPPDRLLLETDAPVSCARAAARPPAA